MILTPRAKQLAEKILNEIPVQLTEPVWELISLFRTGQSAVVELGERAGAVAHYGVERTPAQMFDELVAAEQRADAKVDVVTAMERAAAKNPDAYNAYRRDSYAFQA